jgi:hypothetical protein
MANVGILGIILILVVLAIIYYIWNEEKKKAGMGVQNLLYLGAIFVLLGLIVESDAVMKFGFIFLLFGLLGKLFATKN